MSRDRVNLKKLASLAQDTDFDLDVYSYQRTKYYPLRSLTLLDGGGGGNEDFESMFPQ